MSEVYDQVAREAGVSRQAAKSVVLAYHGEAYRDEHGGILPCYGCAHSAAGLPYPGRPSGERPCLFCVRNTDPGRDGALAAIRGRLEPGKVFTARYDNGPTRREPADQYIATDRLSRDL